MAVAPPVVLPLGCASGDEAPPLDALDLSSLSWRAVEVDAPSAALLRGLETGLGALVPRSRWTYIFALAVKRA